MDRTHERVLQAMAENLGEGLPRATPLLAEKAPGLLLEHGRSWTYAMPEKGALDEKTRTLILLGIALATGSEACVKAMAHRAKRLGLSKEALLETLKIARQAQANAVLGHAAPLLEVL